MSPLRSRSQAVTLLADVNHPGSQEDVISNWQPSHSLVETVVSGAEIVEATCLLALAVVCRSLSASRKGGLKMAYSYSPLVFARAQFFVL